MLSPRNASKSNGVRARVEPRHGCKANARQRQPSRGFDKASRQGPAKGHRRTRPRLSGRTGYCRKRSPWGLGNNNEVQPHAVTYAPGTPMRCENPQAELCQSPAMPNGRCRMHGGPSPEGGLGRRARQAVQANVRASWRRTPSGRLELSRSRVSRVFGPRVESDRRVWGGLMDDVHHGLE